MSIRLSAAQNQVVRAPLNSKLFLHGTAGAGKTTAGVHRLRHLIESGVPAHHILVLVPQHGLAQPYRDEIRSPKRKAGADVTIATFGSLAFHMVSLFWPLIVEANGFDRARQPVFLSLELVQYFMNKVVGPEIDRLDYFNSVRINRNRLYGQIVDNLNKAALVGFPHTQIAARLKSAWRGSIEQRHIYDDAQACALLFREYCTQHNLIDFSLQATLFANFLWQKETPRAYLVNRYRYLIIDNVEEDTPASHDLLREWIPLADSALVIYDSDAGYRRFLSADEISARGVAEACSERLTMDETRVMTPPVQAFMYELGDILRESGLEGDLPREERPEPPKADPRRAVTVIGTSDNRYHTQMVEWVINQIVHLVRDEGVPQSEIVVLAPLLSDALRFSLSSRLTQFGIDTYTLRPSRPLRDEPATRALMTWAKLAHPHWSLLPQRRVTKFDVTQALMQSIDELDLVRATLFTDVLFKRDQLQRFESISAEGVRTRLTYDFGVRYDTLQRWLEAYQEEKSDAIDIFFSRLFGEVLSQRGFSFHRNLDAARVVANVIDSARSFRRVLATVAPELDSGQEYVTMVENGVIADQYLPPTQSARPDAVLIAPAYTYLLSNQPVDVQFWINIDHPSWSRRLFQPLTQPYVLSRNWPQGRIWTDDDELSTSRDMLYRVITGLIKRCRKQIYIGYSQYDERGNERVGDLRIALDYLLRKLAQEDARG